MAAAPDRGDQARGTEDLPQIEAARVRRRRVQRLVHEQRIAHPRAGDPGRRAGLGPPGEARLVEPGIGPREERRAVVRAPVVGQPVVALPRRVGARRRQVHRQAVVVARPVGVQVSLDGGVTVAVVRPAREDLREVGPEELGIAGGEEDVVPLVRPDDAADGRRDQRGPFGEVAAANDSRGRAEAVGEVVPGDPGHEQSEVALEGPVLAEVRLVPDRPRIDVAVEHHAPHPRREELGVDLGQVRAVGEAVVVDLARAQRRADAVHVAHRVGRLRVIEKRRRVLRTVVRIVLGAGLPDAQQCGSGRHVVRPVGPQVAGVAGHRGNARTDPARIEADPVVGTTGILAPEVHADDRPEDRQAQAGAARPTWIDQHHALILGLRDRVAHPRHGDLDLLAAGMRVVARNRDEAAPGAEGTQRRVVAAVPGDRPCGRRHGFGRGHPGRRGGHEARRRE